MLVAAATTPIVLDITTLFVIATCITAMLGLLLLSAWRQERIRALAWWGTAYLLGGFSVAVWSVEALISPPLPPGVANALLFVACGMVWSAARIFHGRDVLWTAMVAGAIIWLTACMIPEFAQWTVARIVLSSLVVASYTFLTAAELWRERRRTLLRRWPAIFVPILHGAVFLFPIPLAGLLPSDGGIVSLASGWIAVFALETMLYVVGAAFIVLVLAKERSLRIHRDAASTDELTGLLNRRGFFAATHQLVVRQAAKLEPVSVLMFDLDHFKSINDRFGHATGDEALRLFAATASANMRAADVIGQSQRTQPGRRHRARHRGRSAGACRPGKRVGGSFGLARARNRPCRLAFRASPAGKLAGNAAFTALGYGTAYGTVAGALSAPNRSACARKPGRAGRLRVGLPLLLLR